MPRNGAGTYTLPAGNPVVTGTTISSVWANTTLTDLANAMTDSLSRSGQGSMTATLLLADGTIGSPGLSWGNETTSGLYRSGAGDFRYSMGGADKLQITTFGLRTADGALGTPAHSFISDPDTGMFRNAANDMQLVAGGVSIIGMLATGASVLLANGLVGTPSLSFQSDPDTGLYRISANRIAMSTAGVFGLEQGDDDGLGRRYVQSHQIFYIVDGTAAIPGVLFGSDPDTGIYRRGANIVGISTGGASLTEFGVNYSALPDGVVGSPGIQFFNDGDLGFYRIGANRMGLSAGGVQTIDFGATYFNPIVPVYISDGLVGTPALVFNNATDTGIWRPAGSSQIAFSGGGLEVARFGSGGMSLGINTTTTWTLGIVSSATASAGGGAALPATVAGFWSVTINGTNRKIPYYAT